MVSASTFGGSLMYWRRGTGGGPDVLWGLLVYAQRSWQCWWYLFQGHVSCLIHVTTILELLIGPSRPTPNNYTITRAVCLSYTYS